MVNPLTVLRTIRHLSPRQVAHQLRHRVSGPAQDPAQVAVHGCTGVGVDATWEPPSTEGEALEGGALVSLFGSAPHDPMREGWQPSGRDPLWLYTLHYHGWINAPSAEPTVIRGLLLNWIDNHTRGTGWEPYPTAMRVLHWLGWLARHDGILGGNQKRWIYGSIAAQLVHLERHLERHLDGNHLWTDLVALATAGLTLSGPLPARLCDRWLPSLVETICEQLDEDGVHRERTPTYHCLLAEQLGGVVKALSLRPGGSPTLAPTLRGALGRMCAIVPAFTHPDGDVALWGDSQRGAPVSPQVLAARFAASLAEGDAEAREAGFFRRAWGPWTVLWNAGGTGLDRQVGHIHADALALEISLAGERVLVDAGVGTYVTGDDRSYSRSTGAHNTVDLDGRDQHELWASHRIGGRASVDVDEATHERLSGRVRGYQWPVTHHRTIEWHDGAIRCRDALSSPDAPATVRYFVPATAAVVTIDGGFRVTTARGQRFTLRGGPGLSWTREEARGWRAIAREAPRIALAAKLPDNGATIELRAED
jgi:uncharacterized heparinase superfamily protein